MTVDKSTMKPLKKLERAGVNYQEKRGMNSDEARKFNALSESDLIKLFSSNDFLFLLFFGVAEGILLFPKSREKMEKLYQLNRVNCYELSKQKRFYDWCEKCVEQKTIAIDVQTNRIFSVLLLAHEQKDLRIEVIASLIEGIPLLKPVITSPISNYPINEITDEFIKNFRFDSLAEHKKVSALIDFGNYIVLYRLFSEGKDAKKTNCAFFQPLYINHIDRQHTVRFCISRHSATNESDATDIIRKATTQGSQSLNEFVKSLSGGDVLYEACRWYVNNTITSEGAYSLLVQLQDNGMIYDEDQYRNHPLNGNEQMTKKLKQCPKAMISQIADVQYRMFLDEVNSDGTSFSNGQAATGRLFKTVQLLKKLYSEDNASTIAGCRYLSILDDCLFRYNISPLNFLYSIQFNSSDREFILRNASKYKHLEGKNPAQETFSDYIVTAIIVALLKGLVSDRKFYFDNDAESIFGELKLLQNNISEIKAKTDALGKENSQLKSQLRAKEAENSKLQREEKNITAPLYSEISKLKKQVDELKGELNAEKEKSFEIKRLRELAFELSHEYVPTPKKTLSELLEGCKVVIIGGHENWRAKVKEKYPQIRIIDGHALNFDINIIRNANIVLLFTGNMEHSAYYKVIDVLRSGVTDFDYLGRTINQDLLEDEMADILEKHGFGAE